MRRKAFVCLTLFFDASLLAGRCAEADIPVREAADWQYRSLRTNGIYEHHGVAFYVPKEAAVYWDVTKFETNIARRCYSAKEVETASQLPV